MNEGPRSHSFAVWMQFQDIQKRKLSMSKVEAENNYDQETEYNPNDEYANEEEGESIIVDDKSFI